MVRFRRKSCVAITALALLIFVISIILKTLIADETGSLNAFGIGIISQKQEDSEQIVVDVNSRNADVMMMMMMKKKKKDAEDESIISFNSDVRVFPPPNYNMHIFYYTWYGNPQFDSRYLHWDHPLLPHWDPKIAATYRAGRHQPPDDIGANFYPALGTYSSRDPSVVEAHMQQLRSASVGVLAVSWYPPGMKDDNGDSTDDIVPLLLDVANKYQVKVAFHIEPYKERDDANMLDNVKYIIEKYGDHPAFFRYKSSSGKLLPLFYVYDSYLQTPDIWARLLTSTGKRSVRNTAYDGIFIALLVEEKQKKEILSAGFDGMYTYFATNGFTYGSSYRNWKSLKSFCHVNDLIFAPSVGPGYVDTSIRPWNGQNTRNRISGKYYETALSTALETRPEIISITSFNEWHEGTQIEMAVPKTGGNMAYLDYLPHKPTVYLEITRKWATKFQEEQEKWLE